jgi:hypothetical protein
MTSPGLPIILQVVSGEKNVEAFCGGVFFGPRSLSTIDHPSASRTAHLVQGRGKPGHGKNQQLSTA